MYTSHNVKEMIESVAQTVAGAVPSVTDPQVRQRLEMCLGVLHWAARVAPVEQQLYAKESREMADLYSELSTLAEGDDAPECERIRARAADPVTGRAHARPVGEELMSIHRSLSESLVATLDDVHALQTQGHPRGMELLARVRTHLALRSHRDLEVYLGTGPTSAMVGRE